MGSFELADLIRVNQLVRHRIDFEGFGAWYAALPAERRRALTYLLCEFAHQAGVTDATWDEALAASGLSAADPVVQQVGAARRGDQPLFRLYDFVLAVPDESLPTVFRLFVYLFGTAEGRVLRGESAEHCNHWWHRDLLDERVVHDLLNDPRYYMTAQKDDKRIKGAGRPGPAR
jgi:Family of unknown function (DUF5958)